MKNETIRVEGSMITELIFRVNLSEIDEKNRGIWLLKIINGARLDFSDNLVV